MQKKIDLENQSVTFTDSDGNVVEVITFDEIRNAGLLEQAALHGISQKVGDSYAGALKATEGLDITPEAWSVQQVHENAERIRNGDWNLRTGGGGAAVTDLAVALAEATGSTIEEVSERLATLEGDKGKEIKARLRKQPKVAAILARIKQERADKKAKELATKAENAEEISLDF